MFIFAVDGAVGGEVQTILSSVLSAGSGNSFFQLECSGLRSSLLKNSFKTQKILVLISTSSLITF